VHKLATGAAWLRVLILTVHEQHRMKHSDPARYESGPTGRDDLKEAAADYIERRGGPRYDGRREIVITNGEGDGMVDALFSLTDPGDEVILTDPTYEGMVNRVRLVGAAPRFVPLSLASGEWRLSIWRRSEQL
jgi:aspartate/methionine/tyrosine aminotransferase